MGSEKDTNVGPTCKKKLMDFIFHPNFLGKWNTIFSYAFSSYFPSHFPLSNIIHQSKTTQGRQEGFQFICSPIFQVPDTSQRMKQKRWVNTRQKYNYNNSSSFILLNQQTPSSSGKDSPAISREVINDPVYTLSTARPCSNCSLGTAFPDAIISSIRGVEPNLQFI